MPRTPKKVSQTQLAKELGISQALVSLVLNGHKQGINAETYERIWARARERGYRPKGMTFSPSAANAARQVGIILRAPLRLSTPSLYFGHVQHGLHTTIEAQEFTTVFLGAEDQLNRTKLRRIFSSRHAFRAIVLVGEVTRPFLDQLRSYGLRIVAVSARYPGLCHSVLGNEPKALESLVEHLVAQGHRRFGWLGGNIGLGRHEARLNAFTAALERAGCQLLPRHTVTLTAGDRTEGADAVRQLLPLRHRRDFPTALVAYNTLMAAGAVRELARAGWQVPADMSIASADFSVVATDRTLRITAAGSDPQKLGEAAARLALNHATVQPDEFTDLMLPAQLVIGDTTGPARD